MLISPKDTPPLGSRTNPDFANDGNVGGEYGLAAGLWGVHVIMLLILALLFFRRLTLFSIFRYIK